MINDDQINKIEDFGINTYAHFFNSGYFTGFTGVFETSKYILLDVLFGSQYFLIDKESLNGNLYNYSIEDEVNGLPLMKIIGSSEDYLIAKGDVFRLLSMKDKNWNIKDKNMNTMKCYVDSLTVNSNPCLFLYRIR